jgi:hypothetical protein
MRPAPPQRHGRRRVAVARPDTAKQDRRPAPDATLWRQLPHELYPSAPPPCAPYRPDRTHSRPPSRRTGRSYRPHPLHRGAPQRHHRVLSPPAARNSAQAPVRSEFVLTAKFGGLRLTGRGHVFFDFWELLCTVQGFSYDRNTLPKSRIFGFDE